MADVVIKVLKNGPYIVNGPVELKDADGKIISTKDKTIALCSCGQSVNKPFCDGSHTKANSKG